MRCSKIADVEENISITIFLVCNIFWHRKAANNILFNNRIAPKMAIFNQYTVAYLQKRMQSISDFMNHRWRSLILARSTYFNAVSCSLKFLFQECLFPPVTLNFTASTIPLSCVWLLWGCRVQVKSCCYWLAKLNWVVLYLSLPSLVCQRKCKLSFRLLWDTGFTSKLLWDFDTGITVGLHLIDL